VKIKLTCKIALLAFAHEITFRVSQTFFLKRKGLTNAEAGFLVSGWEESISN